MGTHVCMQVCGGSSGAIYLVSWDRVSHTLLIRLPGLANEPQGLTCLHLPRAGIRSQHVQPCLAFKCVIGTQFGASHACANILPIELLPLLHII